MDTRKFDTKVYHTRTSTDTPFYQWPQEQSDYYQQLIDSGLLIEYKESVSDDGLVLTRNWIWNIQDITVQQLYAQVLQNPTVQEFTRNSKLYSEANNITVSDVEYVIVNPKEPFVNDPPEGSVSVPV